MAPFDEIPTPPFAAWALEADCPYRDEAPPEDPQRVERVLRPLRAAAEAIAAGRCLGNVCVGADWSADMPTQCATGFLLSDTLIAYGNDQAAANTCGPCPANAAQPAEDQPRWAGCHGLLIAPAPADLGRAFLAAWQALGETPAGDVPAGAAASWNRLWIESPLTRSQLDLHAELWAQFSTEPPQAGWAEFRRALEAARTQHLALHVRAYPAGVRRGRHWYVPSHCPRCGSPREENSPACPVCCVSIAATPARRLFARGERPYWPLVRFLGAEAAADFLRAYAEHRGQDQHGEPFVQ